ncbi:ATP-grasp domain-containing protein [Streptomyces cacaoi]|uniref:ATP-grasp domain-containing protein n=1 Tax=Streptomyces cacaoi TaxID=1898 RepID=UPI0037493F56
MTASQHPARRDCLLVVGSGNRTSHERMLSQMAAEADLVLLDPEPPTWQRRWVRDTEVFDPADETAALRHAKDLAARHGVAAVTAYDEAFVLTAAHLAAALGLPGLPPAAAELCRDKRLQRDLLNRTGLSPTRSTLVHDLDGAAAAARETGYPVIVKPRGLSGSAGVCRVDAPDGLAAAFRAAAGIDKKGMTSDGILVEEYLDGFELCVDCWVHDGTAVPVWGARKIWAFDPHPIEAGLVVGRGALDDGAVRDGFALACRAAAAAGLDRTVAHIEVRMTAGGPRIVEINGRPAGYISARIAELATGIRPGGLLATAALGLPVQTRTVADRAAGLRFLYPAHPLRFAGLAPAPVLRSRPWVHEITELRPHGSEIVPPPDNPWGTAAYVMATGPHCEDVEDRLLLAHHELRVLGEPL